MSNKSVADRAQGAVTDVKVVKKKTRSTDRYRMDPGSM